MTEPWAEAAALTIAQSGGNLVNEETGEILAFPDELRTAAAKLEWVAGQVDEATRQQKLWEQRQGWLKSVAASLLREFGTDSYTGAGYKVAFESAEYADAKRLPEVEAEFEIPRVLLDALIVGSTERLNAKRLRQVATEIGFPDEALSRLLYVSHWVRVRPQRKAAPE